MKACCGHQLRAKQKSQRLKLLDVLGVTKNMLLTFTTALESTQRMEMEEKLLGHMKSRVVDEEDIITRWGKEHSHFFCMRNYLTGIELKKF